MQYMPIGALVGIILAAELILIFGSWVVAPQATFVALAPTPAPEAMTNTHALGQLIYTDYVYLFQATSRIMPATWKKWT